MDETVVTTFEQCQKITFLPGVKFKNISPNSYKNGRPRDVGIPHICHFFSTYTIFSTQKRVNRDKTDYAKNSVNCHKTDFTTKNRVNFRFLHICHVQNFEIPPNLAKFLISPHLLCEKSEIPLHVEKFQISPHLSCIEI